MMKVNMDNTDQEKDVNLKEHYEMIANQTPEWFHYTIGVMLFISTSVSIFTNGSVLYIFYVKERKLLERRSNVYIVAVCSIAMITSLFGVPMVIVSCFNTAWYFGDTGCKYYAFLMTFGGLSTMLILAMVAIDQYIFVMTYNMSNRGLDAFSIILVCSALGISLGFALRPLFGWSQYTYEGIGTSCSIDVIGEGNNGRSYLITLLVIFFLIPVSIMFVIFGALFIKIQGLSQIYKNPQVRWCRAEQMYRKLNLERKLFVMFGLITGLFLLSWSPYAILLFWTMAHKEPDVNPMVAVLPSMFCKIWGVFTPFVYLSHHKNIVKHFWSIYYAWKVTNMDHSLNKENVREFEAGGSNPTDIGYFGTVHENANMCMDTDKRLKNVELYDNVNNSDTSSNTTSTVKKSSEKLTARVTKSTIGTNPRKHSSDFKIRKTSYPFHIETNPREHSSDFKIRKTSCPFHIETIPREHSSDLKIRKTSCSFHIETNPREHSSDLKIRKKSYPFHIETNPKEHSSDLKIRKTSYPFRIETNPRERSSDLKIRKTSYPFRIETNPRERSSDLKIRKTSYPFNKVTPGNWTKDTHSLESTTVKRDSKSSIRRLSIIDLNETTL